MIPDVGSNSDPESSEKKVPAMEEKSAIGGEVRGRSARRRGSLTKPALIWIRCSIVR